MNSSEARLNIFNRIESALNNKVSLPYPDVDLNSCDFRTNHEELKNAFCKEFTRIQGKVFICKSEIELLKELRNLKLQKRWFSIICKDVLLETKFGLAKLPFINFCVMDKADATITDCESLVSRTGSIVLSSAQSCGRALPIYTPVHLVIAYTHQLVFDVKDALQKLSHKYNDNLPSSICFASGPSRTGDIERTLVVGVHGPKEVYVFLIDEG
jgi:L-lactate dehydrogenase complex protein LldG